MNKAAVNQHLQFTAEICTTDTNIPPSLNKEKVQIIINNKFPFLDMKMSCSPEGDLQFRLFGKNIQQLKYVGKVSTQTLDTLHAISSGFLNCLDKLTLPKPNFHSKRVDRVYRNYANALRKADLPPQILLTMGELWKYQYQKT